MLIHGLRLPVSSEYYTSTVLLFYSVRRTYQLGVSTPRKSRQLYLARIPASHWRVANLVLPRSDAVMVT